MALDGIVRVVDAFFRHWDDTAKMWPALVSERSRKTGWPREGVTGAIALPGLSGGWGLSGNATRSCGVIGGSLHATCCLDSWNHPRALSASVMACDYGEPAHFISRTVRLGRRR